MKIFQSASPLFALSLCTLLLSACSSPGYNDNPSQQNSKSWVGCPAVTDFFGVYFSVRVKPASETPGATATKAVYRAYCHDVPIPGRVFFTADVTDAALNHTPIGIEVVEQEPLGGDDSRDENFKTLRILEKFPAKSYPKGVIEEQFELDRNGHYAVYLIRGGADGTVLPNKLRIPLNVGVDPDAKRLTLHIATTAATVLVSALLGLMAFRFWQRRKKTGWL